MVISIKSTEDAWFIIPTIAICIDSVDKRICITWLNKYLQFEF